MTAKQNHFTNHQEDSVFTHSPAAEKLRKLAEQPIDLSAPGKLTPERIQKYQASSCGYTLLYGTERITDEVMQALQELSVATKAVEKMHSMQEGAVVNYVKNFASEKRAALHTATRDFFSNPQQAPAAKEAAFAAKQEIEKLKVFLSKIESEKKFSEIILIGIGGSDLGPRAHYYALEHLLLPGKVAHFISNVDPNDAYQVIKKAQLNKALVVVISKSGTTLETATNEELLRNRFKELGIEAKNHFVSITMPNTPMDNKERYAQVFYLWDWVGGRYSTTSMCGALLLGFCFGFDVLWEFLKGAHEMDQTALQTDIKHNLPLLSALLSVWNRNFLHYPTLAIIPYVQALHRYPAHLQQVEMESNGKGISQEGAMLAYATAPILWGEPGTNAQHSFFQLLHQSATTVPLLMIGFKKNHTDFDLEVQGTFSQEKLLSNLFAQSISLATGNHTDNINQFCPGNTPSHILLGEKLTPFSLGALLSFAEHRTALQGFIWGINSFDQEGVQLGKVIANKIIDRFLACRQPQTKKESYPLGDAFLKFLC